MTTGAIELRRDELYEQVWAEPMIKVARKYGITGTGMAKICRKAGIPVPSVGYWQRLQHGYEPKRAVLPARQGAGSDLVTISGQGRRGRPQFGPEIEAQLAREGSEENRIRVSQRLARPHALVRRSAELLQKRATDQYGLLPPPWSEKSVARTKALGPV